jgi:FSR family fosmidomycin resistance protein-like MFS transporter
MAYRSELSFKCVMYEWLGLAWSFGLILILAILARVGSAAYHPYASKIIVTYYGEAERARAMSIFGVGGLIGRAAAPVLVGALVSILALRGVVLAALPAVVIALTLLYLAPPISKGSSAQVASTPSTKVAPNSSAKGRLISLTTPLILLSLIVFLWSTVETLLSSFIPTYVVSAGRSLLIATSFASLMMFSGLSQLIGGILADKYGRKVVVVVPLVASAFFAHLFLHTDVPVSLAAISLFGIAFYLPYAVFPLLAAEYTPKQAGLGLGLIWGLLAGGGGLVAGVFGLVADIYGLFTMLTLAASLPLIIALIALTLPKR